MTPDEISDLLIAQFTTEFRRLMQEHDPNEFIDDQYFRAQILCKVTKHIINSCPAQSGFEIEQQALDITDILGALSEDYDPDQCRELIDGVADSYCTYKLNPDPADERRYSKERPGPRFRVFCINR